MRPDREVLSKALTYCDLIPDTLRFSVTVRDGWDSPIHVSLHTFGGPTPLEVESVGVLVDLWGQPSVARLDSGSWSVTWCPEVDVTVSLVDMDGVFVEVGDLGRFRLPEVA